MSLNMDDIVSSLVQHVSNQKQYHNDFFNSISAQLKHYPLLTSDESLEIQHFLRYFLFDSIYKRHNLHNLTNSDQEIVHDAFLQTDDFVVLLLLTTNVLEKPIHPMMNKYYEQYVGIAFHYIEMLDRVMNMWIRFNEHGINQYKNQEVPQAYFNIAEMLVCNGPLKCRIEGCKFYVQFTGQIPYDYARKNFSYKDAIIQAVPEATGSFDVFMTPVRQVDAALYVYENNIPRIHDQRPQMAAVRMKMQPRIETGSQSVHGRHITKHVQQVLEEIFTNPKYQDKQELTMEDWMNELKKPNKQMVVKQVDKPPKTSWWKQVLNWLTHKVQSPKITHIPNSSFTREMQNSIRTITVSTFQFSVYSLNKEYTLRDVFCKIMYMIVYCLPPDLVADGKKRMFDELTEMAGMCAVGHMNRLVNVLSGFPQFHPKSFLDMQTIQKEIYESLLHQIQVYIEQEPEDKQELYMECLGNKERIHELKEFVAKHKPGWLQHYIQEYKISINTPITPDMIVDALNKSMIKAGLLEPESSTLEQTEQTPQTQEPSQENAPITNFNPITANSIDVDYVDGDEINEYEEDNEYMT